MVEPTLIQRRKLEKAQQLQQQSLFENYRLKWRQHQLFVSLKECAQSPFQPTIESEEQLVKCLKHSPVRLVRLDPNLGETKIKLWATACLEAKIPVFLSLSFTCKIKKNSPLLKLIYRFIDLIAATLLILVLFPVIPLIGSLLYLDSSESMLLRQWGIGHRGKLFRIFKFRTTGGIEDNPRIIWLRHWMCKYKLDELPQLLNVLRGEVSLMKPSSYSLPLLLRNQL